ncbi:MAG TPA: hypothetical protein VIM16_14530 [Mucilaginibacter sp.]
MLNVKGKLCGLTVRNNQRDEPPLSEEYPILERGRSKRYYSGVDA